MLRYTVNSAYKEPAFKKLVITGYKELIFIPQSLAINNLLYVYKELPVI